MGDPPDKFCKHKIVMQNKIYFKGNLFSSSQDSATLR